MFTQSSLFFHPKEVKWKGQCINLFTKDFKMYKTLGIIGGLGPLATAYFYQQITDMTDVKKDQDHIEILIHSAPSIPDRTSFILGKSTDSPLPRMVEIGRGLVRAGADLISIPCITAHYFHKALTEQIPVPIMNLPEEVAIYLNSHGIKKVGIMATDGTVTSGLFQTQLTKLGIEPLIPSPERQADVMHIIYNNIKIGKSAEPDVFARVRDELQGNGAEVIILGCTELSILKRDKMTGTGFLDAMEVLALRSIEECKAPIRPEYRELITK